MWDKLSLTSSCRVVNQHNIAPAYRRRGYGIEMIRAGELQLAEDFEDLQTLYAKVKEQNEASCRIFRGLDYAESVEGGYILFTKQIRTEK